MMYGTMTDSEFAHEFQRRVILAVLQFAYHYWDDPRRMAELNRIVRIPNRTLADEEEHICGLVRLGVVTPRTFKGML